MTIEYELNYEDFKEAQLNTAQLQARQRSKKPKVYIISGLFGLLFVFVVVPGMKAITVGGNPSASFHLMIAGASLALWIILLSLIVTIRNGRRVRQGGGMFVQIALLLVASGILVLSGFLYFKTAPRAAPGVGGGEAPPIEWRELLQPHIGWFAFLALLLWLVVRGQGKRIRDAWDRQTHIHGPHTAEITAAGIVISTPLSRQEYRWPAVTRHLETPKLFMLYISEAAFHILPKRAFAGDEAQVGFRNMVARLTTRDSAFPVLPAATPPPLPSASQA